MGMVVRTNVMAMNANRSLGTNNTQVGKSLEKLSSGFRINRAADDASGLAISEKMKAQIKGLEQASANSQDGISLIQTAEGATQEIHNMLNRMVELATKSANGTIQDTVDRDAIQREVDDLNSEITRIASSTNFNGIKLLDGSLGGGSGATVALGAATSNGLAAKGLTVTSDTNKDTTFGQVTVTAAELAKVSGVADGTLSLSYNSSNTKFELKNGSTVVASSAAMNQTELVKTGKVTVNLTSAGGDTVASFDYTGATGVTEGGMAAALDGSAAASGKLYDSIDVTAGAAGAGLSLQVGDTNDAFNHVSVSVADLSAKGLGLVDGSGNKIVDVSTQAGAGTAIDVIKAAINTVSTNRANLGSLQNRLEYTINNLDTTTENMTSANSRIRDTDMAKEMMNYTKMNILTQAAQAMLAQANQQPQAILQLLQ